MKAGLIPIGEAIRQLGVDRRTLWNWERAGKLRPRRDFRGWRFYDREDVLKLKASIDARRIVSEIDASVLHLRKTARSIGKTYRTLRGKSVKPS